MGGMADFIVTTDPFYAEIAWQEVRGSAPGARRQGVLDEGLTLASMDGKYALIGERWRQTPPIFVRHVCPVDTVVSLDGTQNDLSLLSQALNPLLGDIPTQLPFSVQTRIVAEMPYKPFDVNKTLSKAITRRTGAVLDVRAPETVLSVVIASLQGVPAAFVGVSPAFHNLSDWAGGVRRFKRGDNQVSRAEFKLLEALEQFNITLPERGLAIDLGAAPGGWTRVLRQQQGELLVVAVDPGELHPSLLKDWGVHYVRATAGAHLKSLKADVMYDVIVNDMRLEAWRSAQVMGRYAARLRPEGVAIMTIKLRHQEPLETLENAYAILEEAYDIVRARQLFHNRHEITVLLKRKG